MVVDDDPVPGSDVVVVVVVDPVPGSLVVVVDRGSSARLNLL